MENNCFIGRRSGVVSSRITRCPLIGTELVWNKIKRFGKAIVITTFTQSVGTFLFVSLVFGIVFYFQEIPLYLAFLFGGIALATAPAPALYSVSVKVGIFGHTRLSVGLSRVVGHSRFQAV